MKKKMISIGVVTFIFLLLSYTYPIWERHPGGFWVLIIGLFIFLLFFWLIIQMFKETLRLIKARRELKISQFIPLTFIVSVICFTFFNRISLDVEDQFYGKVIFRACYEGTQNQATFKLRENSRFEIHSTGVFFSDNYYSGQYSQSGDTIWLFYNGEFNQRVGNKILKNDSDQVLIPLITQEENTKSRFMFYYGYCKGLN